MRVPILGVVAILAMGLAMGSARAQAPAGDPVALLPLDADQRLEIYGQPVASEIARALIAGSIDVVVVGPRTAMPERARLIVDGTIALKGEAVTLSLRVRNPVDGRTLETLSATAPVLKKLDEAVADLSARLLPLVRDRLAEIRRAPTTDHGHVTEVHRMPSQGKPSIVLVSISIAPPSAEPFRVPLTDAVTAWTKAHHREIKPVEANKLIAYYAPKTVEASGAPLALGFEILSFEATPGTEVKPNAEIGANTGPVATARAKVRVRIANSREVLFDRVIITDTVVGDRGMSADALAGRVAREVLAILRPHIRRAVTTW